MLAVRNPNALQILAHFGKIENDIQAELECRDLQELVNNLYEASQEYEESGLSIPRVLVLKEFPSADLANNGHASVLGRCLNLEFFFSDDRNPAYFDF